MIFVDGSTDKVGINNASPQHIFDVSGVGNFSSGVMSTGLMVANTGIELYANTPATTTNKLYNVGGVLYFNGSGVNSDSGGGGGGSSYTAGTGLTLVGTTFNTDGTGYFTRLGVGTDDPTYELDVAGNIGVNEYIYHNGDTNTYIRFRGDQLDFVGGGLTFLTLDESAGSSPDTFAVNQGASDIDFVVKGNNDETLIITDAENDVVGIGFRDNPL